MNKLRWQIQIRHVFVEDPRWTCTLLNSLELNGIETRVSICDVTSVAMTAISVLSVLCTRQHGKMSNTGTATEGSVHELFPGKLQFTLSCSYDEMEPKRSCFLHQVSSGIPGVLHPAETLLPRPELQTRTFLHSSAIKITSDRYLTTWV